jgi:hypothetical protein
LIAQTGESGVWPDDAAFRESWLFKPLFGPLNNPKLVHLYTQLNQTYMSVKSEAVIFAAQPSVEHIMPQNWIANWPFEDGSQGMDDFELWEAPQDDPRAAATRKRDATVQTLGNLTILSTALNSSQSNYGWDQKRPAMMIHSLLPINQMLLETKTWDEAAILKRGNETFERALGIWKR